MDAIVRNEEVHLSGVRVVREFLLGPIKLRRDWTKKGEFVNVSNRRCPIDRNSLYE